VIVVMIDLHTHILPGVDDGVGDVEEALLVANEAENQGVTKLVATPHYVGEGFQLTPGETKKRVKDLQQVFKQEGLGIEVLPGAEVYITPDLGKKLENGLVSTINDSRYLLVEFPMEKRPSYINEVFYDLKVMGYTPIISHPERYGYIRKNPNLLYNWIEDGIYAQLNAGSLLGKFGNRVKNTAETLVKYNLVQFIGSDLHSNQRRSQCLEEGFKRLRSLIGKRTERYMENAKRVINDHEIEFIEPQRYRSSEGSIKNFFANGLKKVFG